MSEAEHVDHVVFAGLLVLAPKGGAQGTTGEDRAIGGDVAQDDPLAIGRENHVMFADDIAAPDRRKADIARFARPGDAVAA